MRKFLGPVAILSLALGTPAHAESWFYIGEGENDMFFADADSLVRSGDVVSLKLFSGMVEGYVDEGKAEYVYYYEGTAEYNCVSKQFRETSRTGYDDEYQSIGPIGYDPAWQTILPNSFAQTLSEFGCQGLWRDQPVIDPFEETDYYWFGF